MFFRRILLTASAAVLVVALAACGETEIPTPQELEPTERADYAVELEPELAPEEPTQDEPTPDSPAPDEPTFDFGLDLLPPEYTFGDYIVLGSFVLNFNNNIEWTTVTNESSAHYGAEVFRVPVAVMNVSHTTQNPNTLDFYSLVGPNGQIDNLAEYFMDYDMAGAGGIAMGATTYAFIHFLYEGSGLYYAMFDFGDWEMPVRFPISR